MAGSPELETVADVPRRHARERGEHTALLFEGRATSYAELDRNASRVANALAAEGLSTGARVAFLAKDSDRMYEALFGCAKAGAVYLGINWRLARPEIAYIAADGEAELLFVGEEQFAVAEALAAELPRLRRIVALTGTHPTWPSYAQWRDGASERDPQRRADPEEVVCQLYTSGTTGRPKGVMLANRSFFAVVRNLRAAGDPWIGWSERDVSLLNIPAFHVGGVWWAMTGLAAGATNVVLDAFVGWKWLEHVEQHRVTKVCMVPAMLQVALAEPRCAQTDFASLDCIVYGGSPIPETLLSRALETFGCRFAQIYGLTETGNTAVCLRPDDHVLGSELVRAAGRPYPGVRIAILDPQGQVLPPRAIGEIAIHSPANMKGYWKLPGPTAETLRDGWIHTGDAGYLDEQGFVYVCDRKKDMILYAGENLYPAEIENALASHPAVLEVAVIGVPDERWGELVKAIVVLRPGTSARPADLVAHARGKIADFKLPKSVDFAPSLPRTPSGKIQKAILRAPYWQGRDRQVN